ncbi:mitochondrial import inner membrane translocase subunit Tim29 [Ornithorhynchus anatinus]|uniref:mitochondrial import inner membrane translocase subunit Tim29 n=1 Tax=Ornithorhynchus anatinus TaxID=9258 RepID=UPI0010A9120E|nr:mitochondrial import inner membrane translocase subunit Tim29 [Ornithorhynchus anatinus]
MAATVLWRRASSGGAATGVGKAEPAAGRSLWERLRGSRVGAWCRALLLDYAEACRDAAKAARERPGRAGLYASLVGGAALCYRRAPTESSFEVALLDASASLLVLAPRTRNRTAEDHVQRLLWLRNRGQWRYLNLVFCSLVYEAPFAPEARLYRAQCEHLAPGWTEFPGRVLDVGFLGRWWTLDAKMKDFDINEEEFRHLPARLREMGPRQLRAEANERLYDERYEPVILTDDQVNQALWEDRVSRKK